MPEPYETTGLWMRSLGMEGSSETRTQLDRLRVAYRTFRGRASQLTARISHALPDLTIHDVTHLDALWETADLIAGQEYPFNPLEGFVFGGAVLIHDAALCFEAYDGGANGLRRSLEWRDAYESEWERVPNLGRTKSLQERISRRFGYCMRSRRKNLHCVAGR